MTKGGLEERQVAGASKGRARIAQRLAEVAPAVDEHAGAVQPPGDQADPVSGGEAPLDVGTVDLAVQGDAQTARGACRTAGRP